MSRLGCRCGGVMSTTSCPSPNWLYIYTEDEIHNAISWNVDINVLDFLTDWDAKTDTRREYQTRKEPVEYWYCTDCHRVYEVQSKPGGRWLRIYQRRENNTCSDYDKWKRIYILPDTKTEFYTEINPGIRLVDYFKCDVCSYYLSPDEKQCDVIDIAKSKILYSYFLEDEWKPS